jgi:thiamine-phosphate pyrophosphorylase
VGICGEDLLYAGEEASVTRLDRLYAIVDRGTLDAREVSVAAFARELRDAGVRLVQYRDKQNGPQEVLRAAAAIGEVFAGVEATLILNDRADLAALLGWGVHVGQGDLPVSAARRVIGAGGVIGVSTHNEQQVMEAAPGSENPDPGHPDGLSSADYVAIGPVFTTGSKADAEPVVGLAGVRRARALTRKPLVAIGGITLANARSVIDAGADSVAVIGGLLAPGRSVRAVAEDFLEILR